MDAPVEFRLDRGNIIIAVNEAWSPFAMANDAPALTEDHVLGRNLMRCVTGDDTRMFVDVMLTSVRLTGRTMTRAYRCDSPGLRRFMEMTIEPEPGGGLLLRHRALRIEARPRPVRLVGSAHSRAGLVQQCSMCNRLRMQSRWWEVEQAPVQASETMLRVCYTVCERCR